MDTETDDRERQREYLCGTLISFRNQKKRWFKSEVKVAVSHTDGN